MRTLVRVLLVVAGMAAFTVFGYLLGKPDSPLSWVSLTRSWTKGGSGPPGGAKLRSGSSNVIVTRFHQLWYDSPSTWNQNKFMGIPTEQNPMDVWIIQEIMYDRKPDVMVECGSWYGGSAALWATLLKEANPAGKVISIDIEDRMKEARKLPIVKERVEFLLGSSTSPEILSAVKARVAGKRVLVFLDSLHTKEHVLEELKLYSPLIQVGDYLIVQDTDINGNPVAPDFGPGPNEAVEEFLATNDSFVRDRERERLLFTVSPGGYLKRVK